MDRERVMDILVDACRLWWLSFADEETGAHNGACIVPGLDVVSAANMAHALKCNPGGQVLGIEVPHENAAQCLPHVGKLMTTEQWNELGFDCVAVVDEEEDTGEQQ